HSYIHAKLHGEVECQFFHFGISDGSTPILVGVAQQQMLASPRVIEDVEDSEPVHAEVLGHCVSRGRLHIHCGKPLPKPTLQVIHPFGEERRCSINGTALTYLSE